MRRTPSLVDRILQRRSAVAVREADEPGPDDDEPRAAKPRAKRRAITEGDDDRRERRAGEPMQRQLDLFDDERRRGRDEDAEPRGRSRDDEDDADEPLPTRGRSRDVDGDEEALVPARRRARAADAPRRAPRRDDEGDEDDAAEQPRARSARDEDDDARAARRARPVLRDDDASRGATAEEGAASTRADRRAIARAVARAKALAEQAAAERAESDDPEHEDGGPRRRAAVERNRKAKADAEGDPEGLLAAAARARRAAKRAEVDAELAQPRMGDALAELDVDGGATETDDGEPAPRRRRAEADEKPKRKRPKRAALTDAAAAATAARSGPGLVTRGVQAGLAGLHRTRRVGAWGAAALSACVLVAILSWQARASLPEPTAVRGLHVVFGDGPTLPADDVREWIRRGFAQRAKLIDPDAEVLTRLADYLRSLATVRDVERVRVVHEPNEDGTLDRVLEVELSLREPFMPAMLADGERHWVDADGRVLPGILPAPSTARPVLRGLEVGGPHAIAEALALWRELEPQLDPGLVSEIHLFDDLELKDQRGIVLITKQGSRLIWGRPDEDQFGVDRARKVRDLVHTIRCQGDLSRIAVINVRFAQPFFVMR